MLSFNPDDFIYGPPIKITSPDQFVPLFVAYQTPFKEENDNYIYPLVGNVAIRTTKQLSTREEVKQALLEELNYPYPKQYAIPFTKFQIIKNNTDYGESINYSGSYFYTSYNSLCICKYTLVLPGLLAILPQGEWVSISNQYYLQHRLTNRIIFSNINCFLITLIKAKHIPYLRSRLKLGLPLELPLGSIKVLKTNSTINSNYGFNISNLNLFLKQQDVAIEYTTSDIIKSYIFGPLPIKSKEQYLKDAMIVITKPELMEPIGV